MIVYAKAPYWTCENMDLNAPITETGTHLITDSGELFIKGNEKLPSYTIATEEQKQAFLNKRGIVFNGDMVDITKGKLKGERKQISGYFEYYIRNTYGHGKVDYLTFTDGTKTNINNCLIDGIKCILFREKAIIPCGGRF